MAGGSGTRLWPLSRRRHPKQLLRLAGERSLYQLAIDRLSPLLSPERILVITASDMADGLMEQSPEIPEANFIVEPEGRGTAPVIALGALCAERLAGGEVVIACLTADHFIGEVKRFRGALQAAAKVAESGAIVTLGIEPTYAATGYGYIQRAGKGAMQAGFVVYRARRFKEKPGEETAAEMQKDGQHFWNSGMFIWRTGTVRAEFERQLPQTARALLKLKPTLGTEAQADMLARIWPSVPKGSIDYAIMEGAHDVRVIPIDIGWSDVGSWASVLRALPADSDGNVLLRGVHVPIDTERTLVSAGRLVATIGIRDMIVVDTPDVLLLCAAGRAEEVRTVVQALQQQGCAELL
ncbi:MAG TPA: mannose-1-phosphate guanylyltransferase [Anaerolineales bacterium]|nr:mannose-1-phosphate guanylyltransferase [Anaerolineales bacterium]